MDIDLIKQNLSGAALEKIKTESKALSGGSGEKKALKEACAGFEAILLNTLMKSMRASLPGDSLLDDSHDMDMYRSMHDQYLTEQLSKSPQSVGLKEFLYEQLKDSI